MAVNTGLNISKIDVRDGLYVIDSRQYGNGIEISAPDLSLIPMLVTRIEELEKMNKLLSKYIFEENKVKTI